MLLICSSSRLHRQNMNLLNTSISTQYFPLPDEGVDHSPSKLRVYEHGKVLGLTGGEILSSASVTRHGRTKSSVYQERYLALKFDTFHAVERILSFLGLTLTSEWREYLRLNLFRATYGSATYHLSREDAAMVFRNVDLMFRFYLPVFSFQLRITSLPRSITYTPIAPCQSQIFKFCLDGNIEMVKIWFKNSWASPSVVNQHGENLLHVSHGPFSTVS